MIKRLKMVGAGAVSVLIGVTAVAGSSALAAKYTASTYPTTGTGESAVGNGTITTEAGKIECKTHFEATLLAESTQMTAKATSSGCRAFGFLSASVNMNDCDFVFTAPVSLAVDTWNAPVDVSCPVGKAIQAIASTCEITIGSQSPSGGAKITDNTAAGDVSVQLLVEGITYTVTKDGIGCPFSGTGVKTGASSIYDNPVTFDSTSGASIDIG